MKRRHRSHDAGFTLIETLLATALLLLILALLASVTAQWLPNWNRGFLRAQRNERLALGIERIVADLAAVEFILSTGEIKHPIFDGTTLAVTFIRTAIGPNRHGLEIVRLAEVADERGPVLVRATTPFVPLAAEGGAIDRMRFTDPNVLIQAPYRVQFSYAGADRQWLTSWRDTVRLPSAIRIVIRNVVSGQVLELATAAKVHIDAPADCVKDKGATCLDKPQPAPNQPAPSR